MVHNVKEAHEVQEHGENQEFLDDMEYIMAGLPDTEATSVRCLRYSHRADGVYVVILQLILFISYEKT